MRFQSVDSVSTLLDALERVTGDPGDLNSTLHHIAQTAMTFFAARSCAIYTIDPVTGRFATLPTIAGDLMSEEISLEEPGMWQLTQQTLKQGICLVENLDADTTYQTLLPPSYQIHSLAAMALRTRNSRKPSGVLFLYYNQVGQFASSDQDLLQLFAEQSSFILQGTWLLRRYQEVERIGKEINQELSTVDDLFQNLPKQVSGILDASHGLVLAVYQSQTNTIDLHVHEHGQSFLLKNDPLEGACQYVLETQETLFTTHWSKEANTLPFQRVSIKGTEPVESLIFVPLVLRETPLGTLSIQHPELHAYDHEDLAILQLLANHIALALHNIRLYDNLKLINETGQLLTRQLDTEQALQVAVDKIREVTAADIVILYPYDQVHQRFLLPPRIAGELYLVHPRLLFPIRVDGIAERSLHYPEPIFTKDETALYTTLEVAIQAGNFAQGENVRSVATLPLKVGEEEVGVLFVNFRQVQAFKSPQRLFIEGLAHYAAITIKNVLTVGSLIQRRLHELEILQSIDRELSRSLGLEQVLNTLLELAKEHVPAENVSILLYNRSTQTSETAAALGPHKEAYRSQKLHLHDMKGIARWVLEHQEPVLVRNVRKDAPWCDLYLEVIADTVSELDVPLLNDGEVVGVLNFESTREDAFSQEDLVFLVTLAGQAVLAIRNAQAYDREKRLVAEGQLLNDISKEIISHLDPSSIFHLILERALEITHSTRGNLMIYDRDRADLWMAADRGMTDPKTRERYGLDEGVVGYVARQKKMLNVDLSQPPWGDVKVDMFPGTRSELAVPMLVGDDLLGVLNIESLAEHYFTERDERLLGALASLAVIALQNAEAYERETWLVKEARVLNAISKEITSQLDLSRVFDLILEKALDLTAATVGSLHLYDPEMGNVQMVMDRGVEQERRYVRQNLGQGIVGYVAQQKQLLNVADVSQPPSNTHYMPFFDGTRSELAIPMLERGNLRGVLNIESPIIGHFNEQHERLMGGLADLAVVALQNAERYEKAEKQAQRFELLYEAGQELGKITDLAQIEHAYDIILHIAEKYGIYQVVLRRHEVDVRELVLVRASQHQALPPFPRMRRDEGLNGQAMRERAVKVVHDTAHPPPGTYLKLSDPATRSLAIFPIYFKDRYYGNLALGHEDIASFHKDDVTFFEGLANQLASAMYRLETVQERLQFEQRANAAEEMSSIGASAYEVTHRLGNDLGLVSHHVKKAQLELKKLGVSSSHISTRLDNIRQSVQNVLSFSKDLKEELAKLSEEQSLSEPLLVAPKTLLMQAANVPSLPPQVQIRLEIDDDVRNVRIIFGRLESVLHNLVINAIEALPPTGGTIFLRARNAGRDVELEVCDTGTGIAPQKLPKVFELFFSTKKSSGFGLWSARRIALKNQGDLKVSSIPGRGATFTLSLPAADE